MKILTNQVVDIDPYLAEFDLTGAELDKKEKVYYPVLMKILEGYDTAEEIKAVIKENIHELLPKHITLEEFYQRL